MNTEKRDTFISTLWSKIRGLENEVNRLRKENESLESKLGALNDQLSFLAEEWPSYQHEGQLPTRAIRHIVSVHEAMREGRFQTLTFIPGPLWTSLQTGRQP